MSKTVKRAMRVMMIGLVASLLGANAEAHYIYVFGKYKYCSICVDADFHDEAVNPSPHTDVAEFVVTVPAGQGDILCSDALNPPNLITVPSTANVVLRVRSPIVSTQATLTEGTITTTRVQAVLSDAALTRGVCEQAGFPITVDRLINEMSVQIKTYVCQNNGTCPSTSFNTFNVKCNLDPAVFNFSSYPLNLPPPGTPYNCGLKP